MSTAGGNPSSGVLFGGRRVVAKKLEEQQHSGFCPYGGLGPILGPPSCHNVRYTHIMLMLYGSQAQSQAIIVQLFILTHQGVQKKKGENTES